MLLLPAILLLLVNTVLILYLLQVKGNTAFVLAGYTISSGIIVIGVEILSIIRSINTISLLIFQLLLGIILLKIYLTRSPEIYQPINNLKCTIREIFYGKWNLIIFFEIVILGFILFGLINWFFWIQEYDAVSYHVPRIYYWMKNQSLFPWEESILNPRTAYPLNAELIELWVTLFWGSDQLIAFVPWFSGIMSIIALYGLSTQLKFSRESALFIALIFSTIPVVAWETKLILSHDLILTVYILICLFFLFRWDEYSDKRAIILAGTAFGLSIGTKLISFFVLPGMGILMAYLIIKKIKYTGVKYSIFSIILFFIPAIITGSFIYIQNFYYFGNFLGGPSWLNEALVIDTSNVNNLISSLNCLRLNVVRNVYYIFFAGKSKFQFELGQLFSQLFKSTQIEGNICAREVKFTFYPDFYFPITRHTGLQSLFFIFPGMLYGAYFSIKEKTTKILGLILISISFLILHSAIMVWSPFARRYYIIFFALGLPTCIPFFEILSSRKLFQNLLIVISLSLYLISHVGYEINHLKNIWHDFPPPDKYSIQIKRQSFSPFIYYADTRIPKTSEVAIIFNRSYGLLEYPLWGKNFSRKLERGVCGQIHAEEIIKNQVPFVVIGTECEDWLIEILRENSLNYELVTKIDFTALYKHQFSQLNLYHKSLQDAFVKQSINCFISRPYTKNIFSIQASSR